jgi:hypothetical protein
MNSPKTTNEPAGPRHLRPPRGVVGLGDLLSALHSLNTRDPEIIETVAGVLGFAGVEANPVEATRGVSGTSPEPKPKPHRPPTDTTLPRLVVPEVPAPPPLPDEILTTTLSGPDYLSNDAEIPPEIARPLSPETTPGPVPRTPLFPQRTARGVLGAALAIRRPGVLPDVPKLVERLARNQPVTMVPMLAESGLHQGVQLLLDNSAAMVPFIDDFENLTATIAQVVGRNGFQVFQFSGAPTSAVRWTAELEARPWRPEAGRPVVLATDFGAGARPAAQDQAPYSAWLDFSNRCREAGCPVVAFVPYGRERWPRGLSRRFSIIHWHPRTRASHVRRALGCGLKVTP